jgi:putative transposase
VLVGKIADDLKKLLHKKAKDLDIQIEAVEVMPDHVHVFVSSDPTEAPQRIANHLKGFTSRVLRERYRELRRMPTLWTRSYYVGSVGMVAEATVKQYIENQKTV